MIWYVPIFFLMPGIMVLEYGLMKLMGVSVPDFQFPVLIVPVLFVVFFIGAIFEEIGWTGYATGPIAGSVEHAHGCPHYLVGDDDRAFPVDDCARPGRNMDSMVNFRHHWLADPGGLALQQHRAEHVCGLFFHAMINISRAVFPTDGAHNSLVGYTEVHYSILVISGLIVAILWDWETLTWFRYARSAA